MTKHESPPQELVPAKVDLDQLRVETSAFFSLHWDTASLGVPPQWDCWETFLEGSVPNYQFGGCYALFANEELIYVGLGASRGGGRYVAHGISRRMMAHVYRSDRTRGPYSLQLREGWEEVTAAWTLGLPDRDYLASALESFLIRRLAPLRNGRV